MTLRELLSGIADAIRQKEGSTGEIPAPTFAQRILAIMTGVDTSDATATAADMANGKTAYVNGEKVTGNVLEVSTGYRVDLSDCGYGMTGNAAPEFLYFEGQMEQDWLMRTGGAVRLSKPLSDMGDATAADVAAGKTFTSAAGVKVLGTAIGGGAPVSEYIDAEITTAGLIQLTLAQNAKSIVALTFFSETDTPGRYDRVYVLNPEGTFDHYTVASDYMRGDFGKSTGLIVSGKTVTFGISTSSGWTQYFPVGAVVPCYITYVPA